MPFQAVQSPKCPKCGKSVYAAEERAVGELKFHKECYKCSMCQKMLDSTNVNCHETVLYCKTCHGRKYGPKGYGFGAGAAGLSMDTGAHLDYGRDDHVKDYVPPKAAPGEGCPRCGGKVFAAEEMLAKGKSYHKCCFNCKMCRKPLDSTLHCDGPDKEVYCRVCYGKLFGPKGYGYGHGAGTLKSQDPEAVPITRPHGNPNAIIKPNEGEEACPRCGGKVFAAEEMLAKGKPFHRQCFKCRVCKRPLDSMVHCDGPDGDIYCKLCYAKKYGPKGYGFAAGGGGVLTAENIPGGEEMPGVRPAFAELDVSIIKAKEGEGCPKCGGKVFAAEEMFSKGRSFHKKCFNCNHCKRPLDSMTACDSPDGGIYCKLCYAKKYGPKGYGFAAGSGGVLTAENISAENIELSNSDLARIDVSKIQAEAGKGCPRCGGKVFAAEEMNARGRQWHSRCFNCCHCHRPLDSVSGCDGVDGEIYCRLCYAKKYGPKGYGFAAGSGGVLTAENIPGGAEMTGVNAAHVAIDTSAIQAAPGEGCLRCGGKVFSAEEKLSRGNKWHQRCFNCRDCHRPLDSTLLCDGPDNEIYCKLCYAKRFGPKGYGFASGAGGVLVPENIWMDDNQEAQAALQATIDVSKIKAKEGQAACPRCGGVVFQAESLLARKREWHKQCFNCCLCHRPLDSTLACDAPDGEIYCNACYAKRHGPKGYGYGQTAALLSLGTEDGAPIPSDIRQFGFLAKGRGTPGPEEEGQLQHTTKTVIETRTVVQAENGLPTTEVPQIEEFSKDVEEIPSSDFASQTSPAQPINPKGQYAPQVEEEIQKNVPSSIDPSNIPPEIYAQMSEMQQQLLRQMQEQLQLNQNSQSVSQQDILESEAYRLMAQNQYEAMMQRAHQQSEAQLIQQEDTELASIVEEEQLEDSLAAAKNAVEEKIEDIETTVEKGLDISEVEIASEEHEKQILLEPVQTALSQEFQEEQGIVSSTNIVEEEQTIFSQTSSQVQYSSTQVVSQSFQQDSVLETMGYVEGSVGTIGLENQAQMQAIDTNANIDSIPTGN